MGLDSFFKLTERGTNVPTEVRAGVASFLTMSYNLLVNPQILSLCGISTSDVVVATAASSAAASILCGVLGNLPMGLCPGMGLSAYLTFGLVLHGSLTKVQALTCCFTAGFIQLVVTLTGISSLLMRLTPHHVKLAIVVGMGLLIALIGMVQVDLVVASGDASLVALGDMTDWRIWVVLGGLMLIGTLTYHQIEGGILMGIVLLTVGYWQATGEYPERVAELPVLEASVRDNINFSALNGDCVLPILAFLFVNLFDVSGVMFGLSSLAGIQGPNAETPRGEWGFHASALGTMMAACMGCSPIIVAVENAAGVKEGGRTGLTAVVVGLLFAASLFLAPLFGNIPKCATAPVLIMVGAMMTNESKNVDWNDMKQAVPAFLCLSMMPFTYSIPNGILFGMGASFVFFFTSGDAFGMCCKKPKDGESQEYDGLVGGPADGQSKFLADVPFVRRPSLILAKEDVDREEAGTYGGTNGGGFAVETGTF